MKTVKIFSSLLLLFAFVALTSCNKDDDDVSSGTGDVFLICKIDGVDFEAEPITVGGISEGNNLSVQGNGAGLSASAITITLNSSYNGPGTYSFGANHLFNTGIYIPLATDPLNSFGAAFAGDNVGELEVTLDDGNYVEGTFAFECANQNDNSQKASITEGKFRMKLP